MIEAVTPKGYRLVRQTLQSGGHNASLEVVLEYVAAISIRWNWSGSDPLSPCTRFACTGLAVAPLTRTYSQPALQSRCECGTTVQLYAEC